MGFGVVEEKEIPEYSTNDAGKILKVDPTGVYLQWLQETTSPAELPSQTGNSGRFLTTNGSVPSWAVVNQIPNPSGTGQILNSTGAGTYAFTDNPTIDIIRTGSGSSSGLRIGASNTGIYGLSSTNVMGIITGNVTRQTWDSAGSTISVPLTCSSNVTLNNGLALTFSSQASNRTMTQTDNTVQRMNFSSNDVTFTLPVLNNGTMFYFNPFANAGSTFGAFLQGGPGGTGGVQNFETYFNGVRTQISNAGQTGNPSTPALVRLEAGSIYQCIFMASLGNWHIIRLGIAPQLDFKYAGSATNPHISFQDPPGVTANNPSGLYGSNDQVNVCTNGVERLRVTDTGANLTGNLSVSGTATIPNIAEPFTLLTSASGAAEFTLLQTYKKRIRVSMLTFPTTIRFPDNLADGTVFKIYLSASNTGTLCTFRPSANQTSQLYVNSGNTVDSIPNASFGKTMRTNITYECVWNLANLTWYIDANASIDNTVFPENITVQGGGNVSCTSLGASSVSVGGTVSVSGTITLQTGGNEIRFANAPNAAQNCLRGYLSSNKYYIELFANSGRNMEFTDTENIMHKPMNDKFASVKSYVTYSTGGEITMSTSRPPLIFIAGPAQHYTTTSIVFPLCTDMPDGWTVKIAHQELNPGYADNFARVKFNSDTTNFWANDTVTSFNAGEYKNMPDGSVWEIVNNRERGRWYVFGWKKP